MLFNSKTDFQNLAPLKAMLVCLRHQTGMTADAQQETLYGQTAPKSLARSQKLKSENFSRSGSCISNIHNPS